MWEFNKILEEWSFKAERIHGGRGGGGGAEGNWFTSSFLRTNNQGQQQT